MHGARKHHVILEKVDPKTKMIMMRQGIKLSVKVQSEQNIWTLTIST